MAEVIPAKTKKCPKNAKQKLLENATGKKTVFSKCKNSLKKLFQEDLGIPERKKRTRKTAHAGTTVFFWHFTVQKKENRKTFFSRHSANAGKKLVCRIWKLWIFFSLAFFSVKCKTNPQFLNAGNKFFFTPRILEIAENRIFYVLHCKMQKKRLLSHHSANAGFFPFAFYIAKWKNIDFFTPFCKWHLEIADSLLISHCKKQTKGTTKNNPQIPSARKSGVPACAVFFYFSGIPRFSWKNRCFS